MATVLRATCPVHGVIFTSRFPVLGIPLGITRCWVHQDGDESACNLEFVVTESEEAKNSDG